MGIYTPPPLTAAGIREITGTPTHGQTLIVEPDLATAAWRNVVQLVADPIVTPVAYTGTSETPIAALRVPLGANMLRIGHTIRWTFVLTQVAFTATTPTMTIRIRYGAAGTTADALVAAHAFAAGTTNSGGQLLSLTHTVRGPLAASCAAVSYCTAMKNGTSGIGGAALTAMSTPTYSTWTATPASASGWTVTIAHGNTTNSYRLDQSMVEVLDW